MSLAAWTEITARFELPVPISMVAHFAFGVTGALAALRRGYDVIGVLLLHRSLPAAAVTAGMTAAIGCGQPDPDLVAVEARRHLEHTHRHPADGADLAGLIEQVTPIGAKAVLHRAQPSLDGYDQLLTARTTSGGAS